MCKKNISVLLTAFFLASFISLVQPQVVGAENRHVAKKYSFDAVGSLINPLVVRFGDDTSRTAYVSSKELGANRKLLLVAFALPEEKVFALQMFDSASYSIYKVNMRDSKREEVVVMGLGPAGDKKVMLKELFIIAENSDGELKAMPVKGFAPESVLNAPMQLDGNRNILLPVGVSGKSIKIYWDAANEVFVFANGAAKTEASAE